MDGFNCDETPCTGDMKMWFEGTDFKMGDEKENIEGQRENMEERKWLRSVRSCDHFKVKLNKPHDGVSSV